MPSPAPPRPSHARPQRAHAARDRRLGGARQRCQRDDRSHRCARLRRRHERDEQSRLRARCGEQHARLADAIDECAQQRTDARAGQRERRYGDAGCEEGAGAPAYEQQDRQREHARGQPPEDRAGEQPAEPRRQEQGAVAGDHDVRRCCDRGHGLAVRAPALARRDAVALERLQLAHVGELLERRDQRVDFGVGVRRRQLDAEADLIAGHQRVGGERHIHAAVEQQLPDLADARVVAQRDLDDRQARAVGRGGYAAASRQSSTRRVCPWIDLAQLLAAALVDVEAGERGRQRGDRGGPRVQVRRRCHLQQLLGLGRARDERQQRRVGLGEAADEDQVLVALLAVAHDAVAAHAVRAALAAPRSPITPKPCASSTYSSAPCSRATCCERAQVGRVAGHAVDAVHAHEPRAGGAARSSSSRCWGSSKRKRLTLAPRVFAIWQPS